MILLPCDEAFAFDFLSILQIKAANGLRVGRQARQVMSMLADQVQNLDAILKSSEYFDLHEANRLTFEAIAKAGQDQIRASEVQQVNRKRYLAKRALQEKFWPDQDLMESKTKSES